MNRYDEYKELLEDLNDTPLKLDFTLERAQMRLKAQQRKAHVQKAILTPILLLVAVFAVFVLLVNISPTFTYAADRIPYLRDLIQLVTLPPSLSSVILLGL